jgi:hypothetical protein
MKHDAPLIVATEGVLAGIAGAVAVTLVGTVGRKIVVGREQSDPAHVAGTEAGEVLSDGPDMPPNMNRVTATFVQKLATGIFGASLSPDQQYIAGTAWHLTYGGGWGLLYALIQSSVSVPAAVLGPAYGLALWLIGPGWLVPRMKLMLPPNQQRPRIIAMVLSLHVAFGAVVALIFHALSRVGRTGGPRR